MYHVYRSLFGVGSIVACLPDEMCNNWILNDEVDVLIRETQYNGGGTMMSIRRWSLRQTKLSTSILLSTIIEFFFVNEVSDSKDEDQDVGKAPYNVV